MLGTRPREGFSEAYLAGWDLAEALATRGSAPKGLPVLLHRLPDGTFAPKGLGQVLKKGQGVQVPHKSNPGKTVSGTVTSVSGDAASITLNTGPDSGLHVLAKASGKASKGTGPIPTYDDVGLDVNGTAAGGSTGAQIKNGTDGQKYLVKEYGGDQDRVATELAANAIYRLMGAKAPAMGIRSLGGGKKAISYPLLEGKPKKITKPSAEIGKHYMTDALLANWDFIGLTDDNILWGPDGSPFRVDHGGTMTKRAQGADKPFGPHVGEVESMLKAGQGQGAGKIVLTEKGMVQQAKDIAATLTDEKIDEIMAAAPYADGALRDSHAKALKARRDWMAEFAAGKHPLSEETKKQLYVPVASMHAPKAGGGVAAKYGGAAPAADDGDGSKAGKPWTAADAAKPIKSAEALKADALAGLDKSVGESKKLKTAWTSFDKKMAEFKAAKAGGAGDVSKLASQVRAAKWAIKRAGGDPNDRPEWAKQSPAEAAGTAGLKDPNAGTAVGAKGPAFKVDGPSAPKASASAPDGAALYEKFQSTPYGDSGIVTKNVSKAQADAIAAYLNEKKNGSFEVVAAMSPGSWFVKGKIEPNAASPKLTPEELDKKFGTSPDSPLHSSKAKPKGASKAPKPGDMPDLEAQLKASVAAAQSKNAAPKNPLATAAAKPAAPASMPAAPKPAAEKASAPSVPSPALGPSAGAGSAVPSSYDAEYQPNKQGLDLEHMKPGDMFTMNDGSQWAYHKPTPGKNFHIVKPVGGGKAKPFHGKMQPPFVAPGAGGDGVAAPGVAAPGAAAAPKAAEPSNDDLFGKLSSSVEQAKAGVKSKDMVDPSAASAPPAAAPAPAAPAAPQNPLQAALDAYKAAGGDDPAILASLGDAPAPSAPPEPAVAAPSAPPPPPAPPSASSPAATTVGDYLHNPALAASPGRGPTGKLRNFKAMSLGKLHGAIAELENYGQDPAALEAAKMALAAKVG